MIRTSWKLTAQAFTSITICPLPALGRGSSPSVSVSGPPVAVDRRAFIILLLFGSSCRRAHPGTLGVELFFIGVDCRAALLGQRNLIEPFQQAHLAERVDLDGEAVQIGRAHV